MGKIKKFPNNKIRTELDASEAFNLIERREDTLQLKRELLEYVISYSEEKLKETNRVLGQMILEYDTFDAYALGEVEALDFVFRSERGYELLVNLVISDSENGNEEEFQLSFGSVLTHIKENTVYVFNWDTKQWDPAPQTPVWLEDAMNGGGATAVFLQFCLDCLSEQLLDNAPEDGRQEYLKELVEKHKPIIELYEKLDGLMDFDLLYFSAGEQSCIGLFPDNPQAQGIAVIHDGYKFCVWQYLDEDEVGLAGLAHYDIFGTDTDNEFYRPLCRSGFTEKDIEKVANALRTILDHHYPEDVYLFPISEERYVKVGNPFSGIDAKDVKGKPGELTKDEKMQIEYLKHFFS